MFGSYLTDAADLGDLDLAIKLERRPVEETGRDALTEASLEMARRSGKTFGSFMDRLTYPEALVRRMIKNPSPYISLHNTDELDRNAEMGGETICMLEPPKPRG